LLNFKIHPFKNNGKLELKLDRKYLIRSSYAKRVKKLQYIYCNINIMDSNNANQRNELRKLIGEVEKVLGPMSNDDVDS
jgi:hypothetical protein